MEHQHQECTCDHDHEHGRMSFLTRWLLSVLLVGSIAMFLRPFLVGQMFVRVTSYSAYAYYNDAVRICKKIIAIDKDNQQAWTALGYSYMDLSRVDEAIAAFDQVLLLNPRDKAAASFELGQAYFLKKDFVKAIMYFQRVRSAGPRAGALLDADILKYRHGILGFQSVHSMRSLLKMLLVCYQQTRDPLQAAEVQKEYAIYNSGHKRTLF
jgi:tetratricopeptide (TPR) repeat protein